MANKIVEMAKWREELSDEGYEINKEWGYPRLKREYEEKIGGSSSVECRGDVGKNIFTDWHFQLSS